MSQQPVTTTTYTPGKLIVSIVPREYGEQVMTVAKAAGARGGTILLGHSSLEHRLLVLLGLENIETEIVFTLLSPAEYPGVGKALKSDPSLQKVRGLSFCLDVGGILRHVLPSCPIGTATQTDGRLTQNDNSKEDMEDKPMSSSASHELISVIVNAGFAGDVINAARKAGATGGTIINARGTGREEDVKFFGITIVPEKEFIMIVVPKEKASDILQAVKTVPCLQEPGIGIAFCMDVEEFIPIGKMA